MGIKRHDFRRTFAKSHLPAWLSGVDPPKLYFPSVGRLRDVKDPRGLVDGVARSVTAALAIPVRPDMADPSGDVCQARTQYVRIALCFKMAFGCHKIPYF